MTFALILGVCILVGLVTAAHISRRNLIRGRK
jgi:hypothetical protein